MIQLPRKYKPQEILENDVKKEIGGIWVPARPIGLYVIGLWTRLKYSWGVFTGKYDVLEWD